MPLHTVKHSLRWSRDNAPLPSQILTAALGMAGPIAIGALCGQLAAGMAASLGGLAMAGAVRRANVHHQITSMAEELVACSVATLAGITLAEQPALSAWLLPLLVLAVAQAGNFSRDMARTTTMFIIFMLIASGLAGHHAPPLATTLMFAFGGIFAGLLGVLLGWLFGALGIDPQKMVDTPERRPTLPQLWRHWFAALRHFSSWQYPLRLSATLVAGGALAQTLVPAHGYWILLTTALVLDRQYPASVRKTLERGAGTVIGVFVATLFTLWVPPLWLVIAMVALLAAARPVLKSANYLAYTVIMTPLIILLMDVGPKVDLGPTLHDRLYATLLACALVMLLDKLLWPRLVQLLRFCAPKP